MNNTNQTTSKSLLALYEEKLESLKTEAYLVYLPVDKIYPHPDNPRKDLGDLTELADSIKSKGVLQNLTVVPRGTDEFTSIIGHRRCAAAKIAGLKEVPCIVVEMSPQEQIATMLLENMQRSDLTPYEQAKAFQMMMNFGESVDSIAEKTGFSNTTVRRRLKMAELDEKTLKRVSDRQLSLMDFDRLAEIEDINERNAVLSDIGTKNFENKLSSAIKQQSDDKIKKSILEELQKRNIVDISSANIPGTLRCHVCFLSSEKCVETLNAVVKPNVEYFYENSWGTNFHIYKRGDAEKTEEELKREREVEERKTRSKMLREVAERAFDLRWNFIKKFSKSEAKKHIPEITEFLLRDDWDIRNFHSYRSDHVLKMYGIKETVGQKSYKMIAEKVAEAPEYALLIQAYAAFSDGATRNCYNHMNEYTQNKELEGLYMFLTKLGYEMSDEELEMIDGTLPLYAVKQN